MVSSRVRKQAAFSSNRPLSSRLRQERMAEMAEQSFDLLIVGGGIIGAGIALDAVTRGLRVALVEQQDYSGGTASDSTPLVYGGRRSLNRLEIGVNREIGKERAIVYENGPHVTAPEWMLLPFYKGGTFGPGITSMGLLLYDLLAGVRKQERRRMHDVQETLKMEPCLKSEGLLGSGSYVEYQIDNARLTIEVMKKASEHGAICLNYAEVEAFLYEEGRISGAVVKDNIEGRQYEVHAGKVVNASGSREDEPRELDPSKQGMQLRLRKGVHLVFDQARFPLRQAVYFETPDGRLAFAIPREGKTYLGTTDTDDSGDMATNSDSVEDRAYLLKAANLLFPSLKLAAMDIESSWASLNPLIQQKGKQLPEVSRYNEIFVSSTGLISIAGGKPAGYRRMAERVVNRIGRLMAAEGRRLTVPCMTKHMPISGGDMGGSHRFQAYVQECVEEGRTSGLTKKEATRLARRYGSNAPQLFQLAFSSRDFAQVHGLPLVLAAELIYAIEEEGVLKPTDFWIRRTGRLYLDIAYVIRWKSAVHSAMSELLTWTEEERSRSEKELSLLLLDRSISTG